MNKTRDGVPASGAPLLLSLILAFALPALFPGDAWSQRGAAGPPEHANVEPVNYLLDRVKSLERPTALGRKR